MDPIQQLDRSIELCAQLREQIKSDCYVNTHELGGKTLPAYEHARKTQLLCIEKIYTRLLSLRVIMNDV